MECIFSAAYIGIRRADSVKWTSSLVGVGVAGVGRGDHAHGVDRRVNAQVAEVGEADQQQLPAVADAGFLDHAFAIGHAEHAIPGRKAAGHNLIAFRRAVGPPDWPRPGGGLLAHLGLALFAQAARLGQQRLGVAGGFDRWPIWWPVAGGRWPIRTGWIVSPRVGPPPTSICSPIGSRLIRWPVAGGRWPV